MTRGTFFRSCRIPPNASMGERGARHILLLARMFEAGDLFDLLKAKRSAWYATELRWAYETWKVREGGDP